MCTLLPLWTPGAFLTPQILLWCHSRANVWGDNQWAFPFLAHSSEHSAGFWISQRGVCYKEGKCRLCYSLSHFLRWVSVIRSWMKMLNSKLKSPHAEPQLNVQPIFKYPTALLYSPISPKCAPRFSHDPWAPHCEGETPHLPFATASCLGPRSGASLHLISSAQLDPSHSLFPKVTSLCSSVLIVLPILRSHCLWGYSVVLFQSLCPSIWGTGQTPIALSKWPFRHPPGGYLAATT